jgi:hypothetical protein
MSGKKDKSEKYASEAARLGQPWRRKSETAPRSSRKKAITSSSADPSSPWYEQAHSFQDQD